MLKSTNSKATDSQAPDLAPTLSSADTNTTGPHTRPPRRPQNSNSPRNVLRSMPGRTRSVRSLRFMLANTRRSVSYRLVLSFWVMSLSSSASLMRSAAPSGPEAAAPATSSRALSRPSWVDDVVHGEGAEQVSGGLGQHAQVDARDAQVVAGAHEVGPQLERALVRLRWPPRCGQSWPASPPAGSTAGAGSPPLLTTPASVLPSAALEAVDRLVELVGRVEEHAEADLHVRVHRSRPTAIAVRL